jgi:hypothetical protein
VVPSVYTSENRFIKILTGMKNSIDITPMNTYAQLHPVSKNRKKKQPTDKDITITPI